MNEAQPIPGHLVVTTAAGAVKILSLNSLQEVAELIPDPDEKYLSVTYCSGKWIFRPLSCLSYTYQKLLNSLSKTFWF